MAEAVELALERETHLFVEAGTGTGKTLAYLVPAVLSGRKVIVSTATRALQEQIFVKDLPLVAEVLAGHGVEVRAALMKGLSNYVCLRRYEEARAASLRSGAPRPRPRAHRLLAEDHGDGRPLGAGGSAGGLAGVARRGLLQRDAHRRGVRALRALLRHAHATRGRSGADRGGEPSPLSRRPRAAQSPARRARQRHSRLRRRGLRRGPSARGRGHGLLRATRLQRARRGAAARRRAVAGPGERAGRRACRPHAARPRNVERRVVADERPGAGNAGAGAGGLARVLRVARLGRAGPGAVR